jgi:hypothetical protein
VSEDVRAARRRERRRQQVRRTALLLGVLLVVALAFAVWLALDAPDTTALPSTRPGLALDG